jgi:hypothetical protein
MGDNFGVRAIDTYFLSKNSSLLFSIQPVARKVNSFSTKSSIFLFQTLFCNPVMTTGKSSASANSGGTKEGIFSYSYFKKIIVMHPYPF